MKANAQNLFPPLKPLFLLGECVATPGALSACGDAEQHPIEFLNRHVQGDWGDLDAEDKRTNAHALKHGQRLLSAYKTNAGVKIWVITEWDRSVTTVLLPEEY